MRFLFIAFFSLSLAACATTQKSNCCAQAKAAGSSCDSCVTKKDGKDCCATAKASGKSCEKCGGKPAAAPGMNCCAQAKAEGKACEKCAVPKAE